MHSNRFFRVALLLSGLGSLLAACVNGEEAATTGAIGAGAFSGLYDCGEGGRMGVEQSQDTVRLTVADGEAIDLPASPPGQNDRYSSELHAVVFEGNEAFFMRSGQPPLSCKR